MLLGIASHSLTRRATQGPKQGISHYYDVADKVVIMQRIQVGLGLGNFDLTDEFTSQMAIFTD